MDFIAHSRAGLEAVGEDFTCTPTVGAPVPIKGSFMAPHVPLPFGDGGVVDITGPVLRVMTADLPGGAPARSLTFTRAADGLDYKVRDYQEPDIVTGTVDLMLGAGE